VIHFSGISSPTENANAMLSQMKNWYYFHEKKNEPLQDAIFTVYYTEATET
jgi:hypothetical protein